MFKSPFISTIRHGTTQYIQYAISSGLVINHMAPFRVRCTFECTQCQALRWILHRNALALPSCFPSPLVTDGANYFPQNPFHKLRLDCMCACVLLSMMEWDKGRISLLQGQVTSSWLRRFPHSQLSALSVCVLVLVRLHHVCCRLPLTLSDCVSVRSCW